jgi:hypothetical protein
MVDFYFGGLDDSENDSEKFLDKNAFSRKIERLAQVTDRGYLETIGIYCESKNLELLDVRKLINQSLKDKIEVEAKKYNLVRNDINSTVFDI